MLTGDIPTFEKSAAHTDREEQLLMEWVATLPDGVREEFTGLLTEMEQMQTQEAKIYKALDKLEAVIQHNESDISTWLPLEYDLQLRYGEESVAFSTYMRALKEEINACTRRKIAEES